MTGLTGLRSTPVKGSPPLANLGYSLYYGAYLVVIGSTHVFATRTALEFTRPAPGSTTRVRPLILTSVLATLGLLVPAMRHSFRVYENFRKIHGRYITYLFIVSILICLALIENRRKREDGPRRPALTRVWGIGSSVVIASLCATVLSSRDFMTVTNSPEGFSFVTVLGTWWVAAAAGGGVLLTLWGFRHRRATPLHVARWLGMFVLAATAVASLMTVRADPFQSNDRASHARAIAEAVHSGSGRSDVVVFDGGGDRLDRLKMELQFWRLPDDARVLALEEVMGSGGIADLPAGTLVATARDLPLERVHRYRFRGNHWSVYRVGSH